MTPMRRLAAALIRHAAGTLPGQHQPWGRAMLAELDQIPGDFAALLLTVWAGVLVLLEWLRRRLRVVAPEAVG
jgi:hypothetical protein